MADPDILAALLRAWEMWNTHPLFWIAIAPFFLWWVRFFRDQLISLGIINYLAAINAYVKKYSDVWQDSRIVADLVRTPRHIRSVRPWNPWIVYFFTAYTVIMFIGLWNNAVGEASGYINAAWWRLTWPVNIGGAAVLILGVVVTYVRKRQINRKIKDVIRHLAMSQYIDQTSRREIPSSDLLLLLAGELAKGMNPKYLPAALTEDYCIPNAAELIEPFTRERIIKQEKDDRYYLTNFGATVVAHMRTIQRRRTRS